jgi:hypothetical protein
MGAGAALYNEAGAAASTRTTKMTKNVLGVYVLKVIPS